MSPYAKYILELRGDGTIETERGFATYRFVNEKQVYIVDIYVEPDFRKTREASALADEIVRVAKLRGCAEVLGTVVPSLKGSTDRLKVLLGYGMKLDSSGDDFIVFKKEI